MRNAISAFVLCASTALPGYALEQPQSSAALLDSARLWEAKHRSDLSRVALKKLLSAEPDNPQALYLLGIVELRSNQPELAQHYLQRLQQQYPNLPLTAELAEQYRVATRDRAAMAKIQLLASGGRYDDARTALKSLFPNGAPSGDLGITYYRIIANAKGGWSEARSGLTQLMRRYPNDPRYRLALAQLLAERYETRPEGVRMLLQAAARGEGDPRQLNDELRTALRHLNDEPANIALFEQYQRLYPQEADTRATLRKLRELRAQRRQKAHDPAVLAREKALANYARGDEAGAEKALVALAQQYSRDAETLGELGLLRLRQGRHSEAETLFASAARLPSDNRGKWQSLQRTAQFWGALRRAADAQQRGEFELALRETATALRLQPGEANALARRADIELAQRRYTAAEDDYRTILRREPTNPSALRGLLQVLQATQRSGERDALLATLAQKNPALYRTLSTEIAVARAADLQRAADLAQQQGRSGEAIRQLETAIALDPTNAWLRFDLARLYARQELPDLALAVFDEGSAAAPDSVDMAYAAALFHAGNDDRTRARAALGRIEVSKRTPAMQKLATRIEIEELLARADVAREAGQDELATQTLLRAEQLAATDSELGSLRAQIALRRARALAKRGDREGARAQLAIAKAAEPDSGSILVQSGWISVAARNYRQAVADFNAARAREIARNDADGAAQRGLDYVESLREGYVAIGLELSGKSGDSGSSNFDRRIVPVDMRWPLDYDQHIFARADYLDLSSGALQLGNFSQAAEYGKVLALTPPFASGAIDQAAKGTMFGIGYEAGPWRYDIGHMPTGFPASYWVGGARYADSIEQRWLRNIGLDKPYVTLDVARRPVTSSLVAFAGAKDPISGEVWGGVHSTGIDARASQRFDPFTVYPFTVYAGAGWHRLDGENVLANTEQRLRAGVDWDWRQHDDNRVTVGGVVNYWRYRENERYYTFGHGGYYSPQTYLSFGLPIEWSGRQRDLSWRVRGAISQSFSDEKAMPFYPTDAALQTQAQTAGLRSPTYSGGSGSGIGRSLSGAVEYRLSPLWSVGAKLELERSDFYTPNTFGLYLRYRFAPRGGPMPLPQPPTPYAYF